MNGFCIDGIGKTGCYSQEQYFKAASYCRGLDDVYYADSESKDIDGRTCPKDAILTSVSGKLQCRQLIPNAFDDENSGNTITSVKTWVTPSWTSGPVRVTDKVNFKFCSDGQFATGIGASLGCRSVRPTQESFVKKAAEDHW